MSAGMLGLGFAAATFILAVAVWICDKRRGNTRRNPYEYKQVGNVWTKTFRQ